MRQFKRGDTSPDNPGLVFWRRKHGKDVWYTKAAAAKANASKKAVDARQRATPKYQRRMRAYFKRWVKTPAGKRWMKAGQQKAYNSEQGRMRALLRSRLASALRAAGAKKCATMNALLGCSIADFRLHLQKQFKPGMNWNARQVWEIDHIRPLATFDLTDPEQQRLAFHFTNCQPLFRSANRSKGKRAAST